MSKTGIFFGSTTGNTEGVAEIIHGRLQGSLLKNISDTRAEDLLACDNIIVGVSTWGQGDLQDDWDNFIGKFSNLNLKGKKLAIFGTGDQSCYPDTFVDAMGIIYEEAQKTGAEIIGSWPIDGYDFSESKAQKDNSSFVGLVIDEDNQPELTTERISGWLNILNINFI